MKVVQYKVARDKGETKVKFWLCDNPKMFAEESFVVVDEERLRYRIKLKFKLDEPFELLEKTD